MKRLVVVVAALAAPIGCAEKPPPPPPPPAPSLALAADRPFDGVFSGTAVLLEPRGDCNAGGSAELVIRDNVVRYHDSADGSLTGHIEPTGVVDLRFGDRRLVGLVEGDAFTARLLGGACEYRYTFNRRHAAVPSGGGH